MQDLSTGACSELEPGLDPGSCGTALATLLRWF